MTEVVPMVGELYQVKHYNYRSRVTVSEGDIMLIVDIENLDTAPAPWKRNISLLTNGNIRNMSFTDFKNLIRHGELAKVEV
jgi:hypothetical protein